MVIKTTRLRKTHKMKRAKLTMEQIIAVDGKNIVSNSLYQCQYRDGEVVLRKPLKTFLSLFLHNIQTCIFWTFRSDSATYSPSHSVPRLVARHRRCSGEKMLSLDFAQLQAENVIPEP